LADADEPEAFDAVRVLVRAAGSRSIAGLVSERFHIEFVEPLAKRLRGPDTAVRASLIASYVIGLAAMRHGFESPAFTGRARARATRLAAAAIQACVDG
jgi:hypothetical protein